MTPLKCPGLDLAQSLSAKGASRGSMFFKISFSWGIKTPWQLFFSKISKSLSKVLGYLSRSSFRPN